jgi:hypothetical protein
MRRPYHIERRGIYVPAARRIGQCLGYRLRNSHVKRFADACGPRRGASSPAAEIRCGHEPQAALSLRAKVPRIYKQAASWAAVFGSLAGEERDRAFAGLSPVPATSTSDGPPTASSTRSRRAVTFAYTASPSCAMRTLPSTCFKASRARSVSESSWRARSSKTSRAVAAIAQPSGVVKPRTGTCNCSSSTLDSIAPVAVFAIQAHASSD